MEMKMAEAKQHAQEKFDQQVRSRTETEVVLKILLGQSRARLNDLQTHFSETEATLLREVNDAKEQADTAKEQVQKLQKDIEQKRSESDAEKDELHAQLDHFNVILEQTTGQLVELTQKQAQATMDNEKAMQENKSEIAALQRNVDHEQQEKIKLQECLETTWELLATEIKNAQEASAKVPKNAQSTQTRPKDLLSSRRQNKPPSSDSEDSSSDARSENSKTSFDPDAEYLEAAEVNLQAISQDEIFTTSAVPILEEIRRWKIDDHWSEDSKHINNVNLLVRQCQEEKIKDCLVDVQTRVISTTTPILRFFNYDKKSDFITWNTWGNLFQGIDKLSRVESSFQATPFFPNFTNVVWHDKRAGFRPCRGPDKSEFESSRKTLLELLEKMAQSNEQEKGAFLQNPYVGISTLIESAPNTPLVTKYDENKNIVICHELNNESNVDYMKTFRMNGNIYSTLQHFKTETERQTIVKQALQDDSFQYLNDSILESYLSGDKLDISQFFAMFITPGRMLQLDDDHMTCIEKLSFNSTDRPVEVHYGKLALQQATSSHIADQYDITLTKENITDFIQKIFTTAIYETDRDTVEKFINDNFLKQKITIENKLNMSQGLFCTPGQNRIEIASSTDKDETRNIIWVVISTQDTRRWRIFPKQDLKDVVYVDLENGSGRIIGATPSVTREINQKPPITENGAAEISAAPAAMPTSAQCFPTYPPTPYASPPMQFCGVCAPCQDLAARMAYGSAPPGSDWDHNPFRAPAVRGAYGQYRAPPVTHLSCVPPHMGYRPQQVMRGCPPMAPQGACTYMQCPPETPWMPVHAGNVTGMDRRKYYVALGMH